MNTPFLNVYEIDDGETWHYIAANPERALEFFFFDNYSEFETMQEFRKEFPEITVSQCNPNTKLTIRFEADESHSSDYSVTKTCAEWAASQDEGFLCSTLF